MSGKHYLIVALVVVVVIAVVFRVSALKTAIVGS